jgi:hypothetical protein
MTPETPDTSHAVVRRLRALFPRKTGQQRWQAQAEMDEGHLENLKSTARIATRLGLTSIATRKQEEIRRDQWMADRRASCPNNPANGGDGFDTGDGNWTERRGSDWQYVEDALGL